MVQDLAVRAAPRMVASLSHEIVTVRGVERVKDHILRRVSMGRAGKRRKVDIAYELG